MSGAVTLHRFHSSQKRASRQRTLRRIMTEPMPRCPVCKKVSMRDAMLALHLSPPVDYCMCKPTPPKITPKKRFRVLERDGFRCVYCGAMAPNVVLHVDHIIPLSRGGTNEIDNLCTACWACNVGKGARIISVKSIGDIHEL